MELKDWIYSIGLILTFGVSVFSLILNIKNRRNAIREHLYKEQFAYFIKLSEILGRLVKCYEDVLLEGELLEGKYSEIEKLNFSMELLTDQNDLIIPNEIISILYKVESESRKLESIIFTKSGDIVGEDLEPFYKVYDELLEDIRAFMGVDALSDENKKLYNKK